MSTISAVGTANVYRPLPTVTRDPMSAVAQTLGLSSYALRSELNNGKTLSDLATAGGVAKDELLSAIQKGMPVGATDSIQAVQQVANAQGALPPPPPPGGKEAWLKAQEEAQLKAREDARLQRIGEVLDEPAEKLKATMANPADLVKSLQNKGYDLGQLGVVLNSGDLIDTRV